MIRESHKIAPAFSEQTRNSLVSNKNIILYYYYLKNNYPRTGLAEHLFRDQVEKDFFLNKENWCQLENYVNFVEKAMNLTGNFELPRIVGSLLLKYQKECRLQEFKDALSQNLNAFLKGPTAVFRDIAFYNSLFNHTKDMEFISGKNGECIIKTKFKPNVNPIFDYISEPYILGIFDSILDLFGIEDGKTENILKEYDLKQLLEKKFYKKGAVRERRGWLFLNNRPIAKKVKLIQDKRKGVFLESSSNSKEGGRATGYKIVKNVYWYRKYLLLKEGEIYNAPYFITKISWRKTPYLRNTLYVLKNRVHQDSPFGENYTSLLQKRMAKEQESIRIRAERQKVEEEYHQMLLENYVHPRFINRAKLGPIPFKNIFVTNIFLDVHQSTAIRSRIGDKNYRKNKNFLLYLIKTALEETAGEWGWLNKVMGDGCYVVTGSYNYFRDENSADHIMEAVKFSSRLIKKVEETKNGSEKAPLNLQDFFLRFGIEAGQVEIGETLEQKAHEKGAPPGNLRIFDVDGRSINLAKRIEENSKYILNHGQNGSNHGIFIGPEAMNYLKHTSYYSRLQTISLKDIGQQIKDFEEVNTIGKIHLDHE